MRRCRFAVTLAASLAPVLARADLWSFDSSVETRLETNDNTRLVSDPAGTVVTLSVATVVVASRRVENATTSINGTVVALEQRGPGAADRVDGRFVLSQSLNDLRNTYNLSATLAQDFNNETVGLDVTQGLGRRRSAELNAAWVHAWSERLSLSVQGALERTGFGQALTEATDFRNASVSAGLTYLLSEVSTGTTQFGRSHYRTESGAYEARTDSIDVGMSQVFSERANASLNLGVYRTRTTQETLRAACPLQVNFCEAGLVPFIVVAEPATDSRTGLQFSSSARLRIDEVTDLSFSAARRQAPSGSGRVVRGDTLSVNANRGLSPTLNASIGYAQVRSVSEDDIARTSSGQQTLAVTLTKQLAPTLTAMGGWRHALANRASNGQSARANTLYVSLKYDWAKIEASR